MFAGVVTDQYPLYVYIERIRISRFTYIYIYLLPDIII